MAQLPAARRACPLLKLKREKQCLSGAQDAGTLDGGVVVADEVGDVVGVDGREFGGFGAFAWDLSDSFVAGIDLGVVGIALRERHRDAGGSPRRVGARAQRRRRPRAPKSETVGAGWGVSSPT